MYNELVVDKIVDFDVYCKKCKYKNLDESEDPCFECVGHPTNVYSHRPVNFKEAECNCERKEEGSDDT